MSRQSTSKRSSQQSKHVPPPAKNQSTQVAEAAELGATDAAGANANSTGLDKAGSATGASDAGGSQAVTGQGTGQEDQSQLNLSVDMKPRRQGTDGTAIIGVAPDEPGPAASGAGGIIAESDTNFAQVNGQKLLTGLNEQQQDPNNLQVGGKIVDKTKQSLKLPMENTEKGQWNDEGFDKDGFDREGYNREGVDRAGLNRDGDPVVIPPSKGGSSPSSTGLGFSFRRPIGGDAGVIGEANTNHSNMNGGLAVENNRSLNNSGFIGVNNIGNNSGFIG